MTDDKKVPNKVELTTKSVDRTNSLIIYESTVKLEGEVSIMDLIELADKQLSKMEESNDDS